MRTDTVSWSRGATSKGSGKRADVHLCVCTHGVMIAAHGIFSRAGSSPVATTAARSAEYTANTSAASATRGSRAVSESRSVSAARRAVGSDQ